MRLSPTKTYLHHRLGVGQKSPIDQGYLKGYLVFLVRFKRKAAGVVYAGHFVAVRIQLNTGGFVELHASEIFLDGGRNCGVGRGCFVRQVAGELLEVQTQLGFAADHVGGSDYRVSGEVLALGLAINIFPSARVVQVNIDQDLATHWLSIGVTIKGINIIV